MHDSFDTDRLDISLEEDRYDRLRLIPWWDQKRLREARIMVVGAGALGNEIIKNLALLGIGHILITDLDTIEDSNLTRAILFRAADNGCPKAETAAARAVEINPDVNAIGISADVNYDLGLGVFRAMDLVIGALDNREARVTINANCWKLGIPWVDGAIETVQGVARVFTPSDELACYECTMSELDYRLLNLRRSCAMLSSTDVVEGKVPTTPTIASLVGGIQVQEAVKLLHADRELPVLAGRGFVFNGITNDSYVVEYTRRDECPAHDTMGEIVELPHGIADLSGAQMLELVRGDLGPQANVEFERELLIRLQCTACDREYDIFRSLGKVSREEALCQACGEMCDPVLSHELNGSENYLDRSLGELGLPPYDIITGRDGLNMRHYLMAADRASVLGNAF